MKRKLEQETSTIDVDGTPSTPIGPKSQFVEATTPKTTDFNNFAKNLDRFNLSVASPEGGRPRIVFTASDNKTGKVYNLIELRYTFMQSHGRHRLFIEAFPAFKMLSKDIIKDNQ